MIWDEEMREWVGPDIAGWHDRPDDLGPDDIDDDSDDEYPRDLDDETPDDRRTLIALHARQYWMTHR